MFLSPRHPCFKSIQYYCLYLCHQISLLFSPADAHSQDYSAKFNGYLLGIRHHLVLDFLSVVSLNCCSSTLGTLILFIDRFCFRMSAQILSLTAQPSFFISRPWLIDNMKYVWVFYTTQPWLYISRGCLSKIYCLTHIDTKST